MLQVLSAPAGTGTAANRQTRDACLIEGRSHTADARKEHPNADATSSAQVWPGGGWGGAAALESYPELSGPIFKVYQVTQATHRKV